MPPFLQGCDPYGGIGASPFERRDRPASLDKGCRVVQPSCCRRALRHGARDRGNGRASSASGAAPSTPQVPLSASAPHSAATGATATSPAQVPAGAALSYKFAHYWVHGLVGSNPSSASMSCKKLSKNPTSPDLVYATRCTSRRSCHACAAVCADPGAAALVWNKTCDCLPSGTRAFSPPKSLPGALLARHLVASALRWLSSW